MSTFDDHAREVRRAKKLGKHDYGGDLPNEWIPDPDDVARWLRNHAPWMCWAFEWDDSDELTKVPRVGHGDSEYRASVTDPDNWADFETALETARRNGWGVGVVFDASNDAVGIDIDDGRDPATGRPSDDAKDIIQRADTWTEVSVSGTGYHPIALGELLEGGNRRGDVEMYDTARFFATTGQHVEGTPEDIQPRQDAIEALHRDYIADDEPDAEADPEVDAEPATNEPKPETVGEIGDDELIERAKNAKNGAEFSRLWNGSTAGYDSHSEARLALANYLAFWTGGDERRMLRLFEESNLYRDDDDQRTFENYEIPTALEGRTEFYNPGSQPGRVASDGGTAAASSGTAGPGADDAPTLSESVIEAPEQWFDTDTQTVTIRPVSDYALDELAERFEDGEIPGGTVADILVSDDMTDDGREALAAWRNDPEAWTVEIAEIDTSPWSEIIPEFYADTKESRGRRKDKARQAAVDQLLRERDLLQSKEGRTVFVYDEDRGYYRRDGAEADLDTHLEDRLDYAYSPARSQKIIKTACARYRKFADEIGGPKRELCVSNGVLDISEPSNPEQEPHTPDKLFTSGLPVEYDSDAECPRFMEFVNESVEDDDLPKLQEYLGYTLLVGEQPFKKAMFLVGPTDSGKGTFLGVVESLLGKENVASETLYDLINTRWGPHSLYGRAANIRNEITPGGVKNVQKFKELTGGEDRISAEDKNKPKYEFTVTQKLWFATNQFPDVEGADEAFYNRLLFVSFPNRVPDGEKDQELDEKLRAELSGILNWALEGLARLLETGQFTDVRDQQTKESLVEEFGGLEERFKHACLEITGDDQDMVVKGDLYDLALAYAGHSGFEDRPTQRQFTTNMKEIQGVSDSKERVEGESERVYTGLRVKPKAIEALEGDVRYRTSDGDSSRGPTSVTDY